MRPRPVIRLTTWGMLLAAWLVALAATLGALFIGEVMGQAPCLLCWYQRIAMFPLAILLGIACLRDDTTIRVYALPLVFAGGAVAAWHSLLYAGIIPKEITPCGQDGPSCSSASMTIMGGLPLPMISLAAFAAIALLLLTTYREKHR